MTIDLQLESVASAIAALNITDVMIQDIDAIPPQADTVRGAVLFPDPGGFVTDLTVTRDAWWSGATSILTIEYNLNYIFFYVPTSSGRGALSNYAGMVSTWVDIVNVIMGSDAIHDRCTLSLVGVPIFGPMTDPSGKPFNGCSLTFHVSEQIN